MNFSKYMYFNLNKRTLFLLLVLVSSNSYSQWLKNASIYIESEVGFSEMSYKKNKNGDLDSKAQPSYNISLKNLVFGNRLKLGIALKYGVFGGSFKEDHLYNNYLSDNSYEYNIHSQLISFGLVLQTQFFNSEKFALYLDFTPYFSKILNSETSIKLDDKIIYPSYNLISENGELEYKSKLNLSVTIAAMINPNKRLVPLIGISSDTHNNMYLTYTDDSYRVGIRFINIGLQYKLYKTQN